MTCDFQWVPAGAVYRYSRTAGVDDVTADGHPNFKYAFRPRQLDDPQLQLERGISIPKEVAATDGPRRPTVLLRSSPWKAGTSSTPWHDEYDIDRGTVRYFGDSKPGTEPIGHGARGNRTLLELSPLFLSRSRELRQLAPPIAVFRGESTEVEGRGLIHKGFVRLIGLAILRSHEQVRQTDGNGTPFSNIAFNLRLCPLDDTAGRIDWNWINDRRDPRIPAPVANLRAPYAWRHWIETGDLP